MGKTHKNELEQLELPLWPRYRARKDPTTGAYWEHWEGGDDDSQDEEVLQEDEEVYEEDLED